MPRSVNIGGKEIGDGRPCYIVAEIGINHNGDMENAKLLIDAAVQAGCNAVKFQKRTPELCVPINQQNQQRDTPWGTMTYLDYRHRVEFGVEEYSEIDRYCKEKNIDWFASCWDEPSVDLLEQFDLPCYKIPSAALTADNLVKHVVSHGRPVVLSTGMSTDEEINHAVSLLGKGNHIICHTTSTYPCPVDELNLRMLHTLRSRFDGPIGYSGHEVGIPTTLAAVALGANLVERHITLDRSIWGTDQAASVEPVGLSYLVRHIRSIESAMGDGVKHVYDSEYAARIKLRINN